jgi:transcriptional regulator with XRE-family HTH domain
VRDLVAQIEERMIRARIKQARKEAGLTQHQLAELIEVIPRSVQNYEDVEAGRVPWAKMNQIAAAVGRSSEWLIHGDPHEPLEALSSEEAKELRKQLDRIEEKLDKLLNPKAPAKTPRKTPLPDETRKR